MSAPLASAVYEGRVWHRRYAPSRHAFRYRMAQLYLDLDEIGQVFAHRWLWSVDRRNLAEFRRDDYLGPHTKPLADAVRDRVAERLGRRPEGPVRLLTHLRYAGYVFNPVSFYYCFRPDGRTLDAVLAEITNTPWRERHSYVLPVEEGIRYGDGWEWRFDKAFHVSPFMPMACAYRWRLDAPERRLRVHMRVSHEHQRTFDANLSLIRQPLDGRTLARVLWRYPLMTAQVIGSIHWQALRLWMKRTPVHDHPSPADGAP
ncbi:DUF1365 domain-containing protein [Marilutibacter maris]|uniref:Chromosome partitioning protein ParA n=1 Tax=Marilutibacter maris TaxID=1605891 RepID=A0A2U9T6V3_9GAMM|nr:DUF1365 domain-containing protein [Lysobacter maris]AWV06684.1 chromosome partitioning protein ParA [Lysobacter maris]